MKIISHIHLFKLLFESLRVIKRKIECSLYTLFTKTCFLSSMYYFLISKEFDGEHLSVLHGRLKYIKNNENNSVNSALLRRNIHRLEKGLIMRPRRDLFAESFILETVNCYGAAVSFEGYCADEVKWAKDILDEFFLVVEQTELIKIANKKYKLFNQAKKISEDTSTLKYVPYSQSKLVECEVSFMQLQSLFIKRRSVRWYLDRQVPIELIKKAVDIATLAPSACNRQPYRFLVTNSRRKAFDISSLTEGTSGFSENLPALIIIIGDLSSFRYERDRHLIYIDASFATMQLMLALETLDLSTCPINWPDTSVADRKMRGVIKLAEHERVVMLLAVGYADPNGGIPYSQKKKSNIILGEV